MYIRILNFCISRLHINFIKLNTKCNFFFKKIVCDIDYNIVYPIILSKHQNKTYSNHRYSINVLINLKRHMFSSNPFKEYARRKQKDTDILRTMDRVLLYMESREDRIYRIIQFISGGVDKLLHTKKILSEFRLNMFWAI